MHSECYYIAKWFFSTWKAYITWYIIYGEIYVTYDISHMALYPINLEWASMSNGRSGLRISKSVNLDCKNHKSEVVKWGFNNRWHQVNPVFSDWREYMTACGLFTTVISWLSTINYTLYVKVPPFHHFSFKIYDENFGHYASLQWISDTQGNSMLW